MLEPPPGADRVDRGLRGREYPQPVVERTHTPPRLVRRDHRAAADLLAQRRIRQRRLGGGAVQQLDQTALGDPESELNVQHAGDLLHRHAQLGVQLDHQRGDVRTQLGSGGAQGVRGLQRVPALHSPPTLDAAAHLDVEPPHQGLNRRQLFLILRRHTVHGDRAAAVGTTRRDRRRVDLVDAWGRLAPPLLPVVRTTPPPRPLAASLPPVLGEGGRLPLAGSPSGLELLFQLLAAALPVVAFLDQLRLVLLQALDAQVARVSLTPRPVRLVLVALLARHVSRIGTRPPRLHTFSGIFSPRPGNRIHKGYHSDATLVALDDLGVRSYIAEPARGRRVWQDKKTGETPPEKRAAQSALYGNRRRIRGDRGRRLQRCRGELVERPFAHQYETGGLRRVWVRGHENVRKRVLVQAAGCNLGLLLRRLTGVGTPRSLQGRALSAILGLIERLMGLWGRLNGLWRAKWAPVAPWGSAARPQAA